MAKNLNGTNWTISRLLAAAAKPHGIAVWCCESAERVVKRLVADGLLERRISTQYVPAASALEIRYGFLSADKVGRHVVFETYHLTDKGRDAWINGG